MSRTHLRAMALLGTLGWLGPAGCSTSSPDLGGTDSGTTGQGGAGTGGKTGATTGSGGAPGQGGTTDAGSPPGTGGQTGVPGTGGSDNRSDAGAPRDVGVGSDAGAGAADARPTDAGSAGADARAGDAGAGADANLPAITIWLAGDSTVQDYPAGNVEGNGGTSLEGWGQELAPFFKTQVVVSNQAIGGRSVAFFMWAVQRDAAGNYLCVDDQGNPNYQLDAAGNHVDTSQWARIKAGIKPGDFLLIQFGTNDETHTCPRFVSLPDFEADLGIMADTVRARGATPIFVTPMSHRSFTGTMINNTLLPYANAMKTEASSKAVEVEDLNLRSVEYFNMVGNTFLATNIFDTGTTHFIKAGAIKMAELIAGEIRAHRGPLAAYLK